MFGGKGEGLKMFRVQGVGVGGQGGQGGQKCKGGPGARFRV
jgi:hypothetical protein